MRIMYDAYVPENLSGNTKYPVIYYFYNSKETDCDFKKYIFKYAHEKIKDNKVNPVYIIFIDTKDINDKVDEFENAFINKFIPFIDHKYPTISSYKGRSLEGYCEAANYAFSLISKYPNMFSSIVAYNYNFNNNLKKNIEDNLDKIKGKIRIKILVNKNKKIKENNYAHQFLDLLKIPHHYEILNFKEDKKEVYFKNLGLSNLKFHEHSFMFPDIEMTKVGEGVKLISNLCYSHRDNKDILLDMYLPEKGSKVLPVIVYIHGGAWKYFSKEYGAPVRFVKKGYCVVSINYRLSYEAIYPSQIEDCKAAIRWLRANADKYGIDSDHIGVWGSSAGAHLCALLGTTSSMDVYNTEENMEYSSKIQAVCDFFGPVDLLNGCEGDSKNKFNELSIDVKQLFGLNENDDSSKIIEANPITYIEQNISNIPPFLIVHGDKDPCVSVNHSIMFYHALKKADIKNVTLKIIKNGGHGPDDAFDGDMVDSFFDNILK